MIARVVPVKRTPRHLSVFDYLVPPELEPVIHIGQLVIVELRKAMEFAVIVELVDQPQADFVYKPLDSLVHPIPLVPPTAHALFSTISSLYAVSLATIYKTSLLPIQKRKLKSLELVPLLAETPVDTPRESYVLYSNETEHNLLYTSIPSEETTLILVPTRDQIETVHTNIRRLHPEHTIIIWHSELSDKEKFSCWVNVRNATTPTIVIGTRSALFLPFLRLDHIIMEHEHDRQYKSYDQQPRYHTRDVVQIAGKLYGASVYYTSFSPSFECYYRIAKGLLPLASGAKPEPSGLLFSTNPDVRSHVRIVEHIPEPGSTRICASPTEEALLRIGADGTHDAVVFVQRKGYATLVVCKACGHIEVSRETGLPMVFHQDTGTMHSSYTKEVRPLPSVCSACDSSVLLLQGVGDEKVVEYLRALFVSANIAIPIVRVDDTLSSTAPTNEGPRILVGTERILSHIRPERTGLYVVLDLDRYLAFPEYNAYEQTVHLLQTILYLSTPYQAETIIETTSNDKPIFRLFSERDRVYRTELAIRKKLSIPPYCTVLKYILAHPTAAGARKQAELFQSLITNELTKYGIIATVSEIYETHPFFHHRLYRYGVFIKTDPQNLEALYTKLHAHLPINCTIDVHPLSILSP
jgi:primosomal protein N' (replication factor Y)